MLIQHNYMTLCYYMNAKLPEGQQCRLGLGPKQTQSCVCVTIYTSASGNRIGLNHFPLTSMFKPTPITVYCTISFLFMHPGVINKPKGLKRSLFPITEHFVPKTEPIHQYSK